VAVLGGLEETVVTGTRERLAAAGTQGAQAEAAVADARVRVGQVREAMEQFARLLVDRAA